MKILKITGHVFVVLLLTVLTQVGGVVYLISLFFRRRLGSLSSRRLHRILLNTGSFVVLYLIAVFVIVPAIAKPLGRVPLPVGRTGGLKPLNIITCLSNRHYVRPQLRETLLEASDKMIGIHEGTVVCYLDAGFPFVDGWPLFPHLSHNDGRKLDLAFCYTDKRTGMPVDKKMSFFGYGVCEEPLPGETDSPAKCAAQGYPRYSIMKKFASQRKKKRYGFDNPRNRDLLKILASQPSVDKIFIEPHLADRMGLNGYNKIRFHGCNAVRHDDHIHFQIK